MITYMMQIDDMLRENIRVVVIIVKLSPDGIRDITDDESMGL